MSVYTSISDNEFSEILKNYTLGDFLHAQGIQAGIENTNYFVTTTKGKYVFTLFEKINQQELELYISLLQELSKTGIVCPQPQTDLNKQTINTIKTKPFTLVSCLNGKNLNSVNINQCKSIAAELARLHNTPLLNSSSKLFINRRGKTWREKTAKNLMSKLSSSEKKLLSSELKFYQSFDDRLLPKGIIHADLFKDNALFENDKLSGIIDFYDACYGNYLYDIAITVNAWCTDKNGEIIKTLATAFLQSYQSIRPFTEAEIKAWPVMLRIAAMRFWLSRLQDSFAANSSTVNHSTPQQDVLIHSKNPMEYQQILQNHIKQAVTDKSSLLLSCG